MKRLKRYIIEQYLFEAPEEIKTIIGGLFRFNKETTDGEIINTILRDFVTKCAGIIRDTYAVNCALNSLYTYALFDKRYGINNGFDVSTEKMYQDIPSEECYVLFDEMFPDLSQIVSLDEFRGLFGNGEFPLITIWKGYHKGLDEIHVTYHISR